MQEEIVHIEKSLENYWHEYQFSSDSWQALEKNLQMAVTALFQQNPQRLVQIAYQLDLSEKHFLEAFGTQNVTAITHLMIEREKLRLFLRKKYQ